MTRTCCNHFACAAAADHDISFQLLDHIRQYQSNYAPILQHYFYEFSQILDICLSEFLFQLEQWCTAFMISGL